MKLMTEQEKEIATIKERNISLNLSDADVQRICEKAGSVGLSVSELLENFIGDLVDGTYSNGSDERDAAEEWFDRCGFEMFPEKTFLRYLIEFDLVKNALELWDDIKTAKEELKYADTHKDEFTEDEINSWKENLKCSQEELNDFFSEFKEDAEDEETGTLEEEMEKVFLWKKEVEKLKDAK